MRNLVPLTKILLTLGTAVWAIVLHRPESLLYLCVLELLILLVSGTGHEISTHETDLIAWEQTEIFLRRLFHEIFSLDVKLFRKWNFSLAQLFILQVIRNAQHLNLSFWIVVDHELDWIHNCHHTRAF